MLCSFIWFFLYSLLFPNNPSNLGYLRKQYVLWYLIFAVVSSQIQYEWLFHIYYFSFWWWKPSDVIFLTSCTLLSAVPKGRRRGFLFIVFFSLIVYLLKGSTFQIKPLLYHWYKSIIFSVYFFKQSFYFIYEFIDSLRISYNAFLSYLYSSLPPALSRSPPFPTHPISCSLYIFSGIKSN